MIRASRTTALGSNAWPRSMVQIAAAWRRYVSTIGPSAGQTTDISTRVRSMILRVVASTCSAPPTFDDEMTDRTRSGVSAPAPPGRTGP
jgi:hypothetical protein